MIDDRRVLIVEDHPDILETFSTNVGRLNGYSVDTASTREEALEKIRRRAYHVAMIDVSLTDYSGEGGDRSGIEIVRALNSVGEGTACIVVSADRNSEVPVDAHDAGIFRYIIKKRIRGPDDYLGAVREAAEGRRLREYGRFGDLVAYLSRPETRIGWESQMIAMLKCDARSMVEIMNGSLGAFGPLLRLANMSSSLIIDAESN